MSVQFYDGTKLLSLKDLNGDIPEIYICTSNRSAGKTTYFNRLAVNRFVKHGKKFAILYRFKYELDSIADKFFKDINQLFFPGYSMDSESRAKGVFHEIFLTFPCEEEKRPCGYAISLNCADQLKKYSHLFSDIELILFDEFQPESNRYCSDEVAKFISLHTSIARGAGKQARYVPIIMISNPVSLINPYYTAMGISYRLNMETKFLRGDGFVMEQSFNENASNAQKQSAFNRAFAEENYLAYSAENVYLNDNVSFLEKMSGHSKYLGTIRFKDKDFGLRQFSDEGVLYCDSKPDVTYPFRISVTTDDHNINYVMLKNNDLFVSTMRFYFEKGCFRFSDLNAKEALLTMVSY